jgi:hypothetical protein
MEGTVEAEKIKPKDLHETTTGEEVREALSKLFGEEKRVDANDISVSMATKPNKGGKLFAIVNLPIEVANKLMKMAKLNVGWSECRIEDKNTPRRCYRCLRFEHVRAECKSEKSLEDCCLKCGRAGHTARLCMEEPYCIACNVEGHRADEMACPEYRKLVAEKRGGKIEQPTRVGDVRAPESRGGRGRGRGAYAQTRLSRATVDHGLQGSSIGQPSQPEEIGVTCEVEGADGVDMSGEGAGNPPKNEEGAGTLGARRSNPNARQK